MTGQPHPRTPRGLILLIRMTIRLTTVACCIALASCNQFASIALVDSGADTGRVDHGDGDVGSDPDASSSESPEQPADASMDAGMPSSPPTAGNGDGDASDSAGNGDASDSAGSGDAFDRAACVDRPVVAVCDPTKEGMCAGTTQCVVDLLAPTLAGYCVFSTPIDVICFGSFATESCPPTFFCYGGACRELCLCDEDCSTGRCCGEPIGDYGFRLCAEC